MRPYEVVLSRTVTSAGPNSTLRTMVNAPDETTAKLTANAQFPGYKSIGAWRKAP